MRGFLPAALLVGSLIPLSTLAAPAEYRVLVASADPDVIVVEATFTLESDVIGMVVTSSPSLTNGTADLVEGLEVSDERGGPLILEALGMGDWRVQGGEPGQVVEVRYRIRLEHDRYQWGPGRDEVAYRIDDGLFFAGWALFVVPGFDLTEGARVRFGLPPGWSASLPWSRDGDVAIARSAMDLLRNCLFLGTHHEETVTLDAFTFTMVIGGDLWEKRELFANAMAPILPAARELFGGMPHENRYLVVINRGDRNDGGAFLASYSMLVQGAVNQRSSVIWGHGMAHEVIHFWNGHVLSPVSYREEWFKEGFTDYLTIILRSRAGLDDQERVFRKLENCMRRYLVSRLLLGLDDSMREAGKDKHNKRMLVYGGGTLVAFALDVRIRESTGGARGIEDLMAGLYAEFNDPDATYDYDDVVRIASEVSGEDQSDFLGRYVDGAELLNVAPLVDAIGLQLDTMMDEFYLAVREDATPEQLALATAMFGSATIDR